MAASAIRATSATIVAGASSVMIGGLFAGTEESPAKPNCSRAAATRATAAWARSARWRRRAAMTAISGRQRRRQAGAGRHRRPRAVPGSLAGHHQLAGGLRATMGYVGCATEACAQAVVRPGDRCRAARPTCTTCRSPRNRRITAPVDVHTEGRRDFPRKFPVDYRDPAAEPIPTRS